MATTRTYRSMTIDANFVGLWNTLFKDGRSIVTVVRKLAKGGVEVVSRRRHPSDNIEDEWMLGVVNSTPEEVIAIVRSLAETSEDANTSEYIYDGNFESFRKWTENNRHVLGAFAGKV